MLIFANRSPAADPPFSGAFQFIFPPFRPSRETAGPSLGVLQRQPDVPVHHHPGAGIGAVVLHSPPLLSQPIRPVSPFRPSIPPRLRRNQAPPPRRVLLLHAPSPVAGPCSGQKRNPGGLPGSHLRSRHCQLPLPTAHCQLPLSPSCRAVHERRQRGRRWAITLYCRSSGNARGQEICV